MEDEGTDLQQGVEKERGCTDLPWCCLLLAFLVGISWLIIIPAIKDEDHHRLLGAEDYRKDICGFDDRVEDWSLGGWPDLSEPAFLVCIESCEDTDELYGYQSTKIAHWCVPDDDTPNYSTWEAEWTHQVPVRQLDDLYHERHVILNATWVAIVLLFIWCFLLFCFVRLAFYMLSFGIIAACGFAGYEFMSTSADDGYYLGVGFVVLGFIFVVILLMCWSSFDAVIDVIEETSKALCLLPELILIPLLSLPLLGSLVILGAIMIVFLYSSGNYEELKVPDHLEQYQYSSDINTNYYHVDVKKEFKQEIWLVFFWFYWSVQIVVYFVFLAVSGAVCDWYLLKTLSDSHNEGCCSGAKRLISSVWRTIRYHLGTVAFAGLIMSILSTLESLFTYLHAKLEATDSTIVKICCCCVHCVFMCIRCLVDRCNEGVLVMTAIYGYSFCVGCEEAIHSIKSNLANLSIVGPGVALIGTLKFFGNFMITALTVGFVATFYYDIHNTKLSEVSEHFMPLLGVLIIAYFTTQVLMNVWSCTATSILVAYILVEDFDSTKQEKKLFTPEQKDEEKPLLGVGSVPGQP